MWAKKILVLSNKFEKIAKKNFDWLRLRVIRGLNILTE